MVLLDGKWSLPLMYRNNIRRRVLLLISSPVPSCFLLPLTIMARNVSKVGSPGAAFSQKWWSLTTRWLVCLFTSFFLRYCRDCCGSFERDWWSMFERFYLHYFTANLLLDLVPLGGVRTVRLALSFMSLHRAVKVLGLFLLAGRLPDVNPPWACGRWWVISYPAEKGGCKVYIGPQVTLVGS